VDQNLSIFERHRRADAAAYASVHSVLPNLERAAAYIQRGIKVTEDMIARPLLNEETRAQYPEIRARLAAMTQPQRMDAITKDILAGRDELAGAVLSAPNVSSGLTQAERDFIHDRWRRARMADDMKTLEQRQRDLAHVERTAAVLRSWHKVCSDPAIVAGNVAGIRPGGTSRGAPGPAPADRSRGSTVAERAAAFTVSR
jgi:hypothetical protein